MPDAALTPLDRETIRVIAEHHWTTALVERDLDRLRALCTDDVQSVCWNFDQPIAGAAAPAPLAGA